MLFDWLEDFDVVCVEDWGLIILNCYILSFIELIVLAILGQAELITITFKTF